MELSKKRERWIKLTLLGVTTVLFLGIGALLIWTETIHFEWSDRWLAEYHYNHSKAQSKRILILGDSQLGKWPMDHCLHKDLKTYCDDNDIGFVNASHRGFGPIEYVDQLATIGPDYKPNLIILFYYVGNDLTDVLLRNDETPKVRTNQVAWMEGQQQQVAAKENAPETYENKPAFGVTAEGDSIKNPLFDWKNFKREGIDSTMIEYAKNAIQNPKKIGPQYVNPHMLVMGTWERDYLLLNTTVHTPKSKFTWYRILQKMETLLTLTETLGAELCLVPIPTTVQVDTSHFDFYRKLTFNVSNELLENNKTQELLYKFAMGSSIHYLDLLPHFKHYPNTAQLYFENDDHLSEQGHVLAFEQVEREILTPFLEGATFNGERTPNFYQHYFHWAIEGKMEQIRSDTAWMNATTKKAVERGIPVDSMLYLDARYVLEMEAKE